jgi:hypothetical protein
VPRDLFSGGWFLLGFWLALFLLGPLAAPWASAADPELARMEAALHQAVNRFRSEQHLIALARDAALDAVARAHSEAWRRGASSRTSRPRSQLGRSSGRSDRRIHHGGRTSA